MSTHAATIITQSAEKDNEWHWAVGRSEELQEAINATNDTVHHWSAYVRTSSLAYLQKKQGADTVTTRLKELKDEILKASAKIEAPLSELAGMHNIMLSK